MKTKDFCSLEFFAAHFNVPVEKLSWGVLKENVAGKTVYLAGVLVADSNLAIEICRGQFVSKYDLGSNKVEFLPAVGTFRGNTLCLSPLNEKADELVLTQRDLEAVYKYRWYDPLLEEKLIL